MARPLVTNSAAVSRRPARRSPGRCRSAATSVPRTITTSAAGASAAAYTWPRAASVVHSHGETGEHQHDEARDGQPARGVEATAAPARPADDSQPRSRRCPRRGLVLGSRLGGGGNGRPMPPPLPGVVGVAVGVPSASSVGVGSVSGSG